MDEGKLYKLLEEVKPDNSFENSLTPATPDYSNLDNWAAYPEKNAQQFYLPDQNLTLNKSKNDVDVFYIHPTGFFEKVWNSNMDKSRSAYERTEMMLGNQFLLLITLVIYMLLNIGKLLIIHFLPKIPMAL